MTVVEIAFFDEKLTKALTDLNEAVVLQQKNSSANVLEHLKRATHNLYMIKQPVEMEKAFKTGEEDG